MLSIKLIPLLYLFVVAHCKLQKSSPITESLGQEVIEIGNPIKELPPGMEEEPSAENDEDMKLTATTVQAATKRVDMKKLTTEGRRKVKDVDKLDGVSTVDEESRIEKELAEIYKDSNNNDYSAEMIQEKLKANYKPIERSGFKFQPDINNKAEVERFRTSIDEISCDRSATEKLNVLSTVSTPKPGSASRFLLNTGLLVFLISVLIIC